MPEGLDKLAGGVGKAIETVPDLYDDALKPATQESGKTLALIPRAINAALVPLRQWIAEREYKLAETEKLLAQKLEYVAEDKIVTPEAYVAVPALQAISYSMNSEELRNLYANLLAKAMNSDTKDLVHPAFVEIIKQLSPTDAKTLKYIFNEPNMVIPIINLYAIRLIQNRKAQKILQPNITPITFDSIKSISISIENLLRLNLIQISELEYTNGYDSILNSNSFKKLKKNLYIRYKNIEASKKSCNITVLGRSFCKICIL